MALVTLKVIEIYLYYFLAHHELKKFQKQAESPPVKPKGKKSRKQKSCYNILKTKMEWSYGPSGIQALHFEYCSFSAEVEPPKRFAVQSESPRAKPNGKYGH